MSHRALAPAMRRRVAFRPLAAALLMLFGCAPGADLPPTPEAKADPYRLGSGDVVRVTTFGEQALTGEFTVNDSGSIAVPLLGSVQAAGMTVNALADRIGQDLTDKKLYRNPSVSVEVVTYRPIFILGEVARPGQYPFEPGTTVLRAAAIAGGFTYRAVKDTASILRVEDGKGVETRAQRGTVVQPGDVITVYERVF